MRLLTPTILMTLMFVPLSSFSSSSDQDKSSSALARPAGTCAPDLFPDDGKVPFVSLEFPFPGSEKLLDGNGEFVGENGSILAYMTMDRRGTKTLYRFDLATQKPYESLHFRGMERLAAVENGKLLVDGIYFSTFYGTWIDPHSGEILGRAKLNRRTPSSGMVGTSLGLFQTMEYDNDQTRRFQGLKLKEDGDKESPFSTIDVPYVASQKNKLKGIQNQVIIEQDEKHLFGTSFDGRRLWTIDVGKNVFISHVEVLGDELYLLTEKNDPRKKLLVVMPLTTKEVIRYSRVRRLLTFRLHPSGRLIASGFPDALRVSPLSELEWQQPSASAKTLSATLKALARSRAD